MNLFESITLAVALAMDCFSVSVAAALSLRRWVWRPMLLMAFLFGLFQALMPLAGWALTARFQHYVEAYDHWLAFGLLAWIGLSMIRDAFKEEEERTLDFTRVGSILLLAVATSIDALAVGISFACLGMRGMAGLASPLLIIGVVSTLFSLAGFLIGIRGGTHVVRGLRPELLGGVILLAIGVKILVEHLT